MKCPECREGMRPGVEGRGSKIVAWLERCVPCDVVHRRAPGTRVVDAGKKGKRPQHRRVPYRATKGRPLPTLSRAERQREAARKNAAEGATQARRRPSLRYDGPTGKSGAS